LRQKWNYEQEAKAVSARTMQTLFSMAALHHGTLADTYADSDADLVADAPPDQAARVAPETLFFSYIAGEDNARQGQVWQPFMKAIHEATERPVEYLNVTEVEDQLRALREGQLHVTAFNTGSVPLAVNTCGFVPVCTLGRADGSFGYTTRIVVRPDSPIRTVEDLRGRKLTFTDTHSNSGFKAPLVMLFKQYKLRPDVDYAYGFSTSHQESIRRLAAGEIEAAAVASDMILRTAEEEGIDTSSWRVIYESPRYPPASLGIAHNLDPELSRQIREVMVGYQFAGPLAEEFAPAGNTQLVAVSYKDDWSTIRLIDVLSAAALQDE
jgi:phosphonate transport system substrate-binding protein